MNKVAIVVIAALASCAWADIFYPKVLTCSFSAKLNTTNNGVASDGYMWGKDDGVHHFFRLDLNFAPTVVSSTIIRCDKQDKDGKCLKHATVAGSCTDTYTENENGFARPFEYDYKETVPCPDGKTQCTRYCHNASDVCYTANSDDVIVVHKMSSNMSMVVNWVENEYFTTDKFVFTTCDGEQLLPPQNPCDDYSSSAGPQSSSSSPSSSPSASSSSSNPVKSASTSSVVKASFVLVLAALLVALF